MADEVVSQPGGQGAAGNQKATSGPWQSTDRFADNFEPTQDEQTVVSHWLKRIKQAEDKPERKSWSDDLENLRKYMRGTKHKEKGNEKYTRTNMIYATMAAQIPELYAQNPQFEATPTDAVPQENMGLVKKFGKTAEQFLAVVLVKDGKLKQRMKANIRSISGTSYGVLKMLYQCEYRGDPIIIRRVEDTQNNIAQIEALAKDKDQDVSQLAIKRDELRANMESLLSKNEIKLYKGFVVDRVKSEDFLVLDDSVTEFDDYVDSEALANLIWVTAENFKVSFRMDPHGATRYGRPRDTDAGRTTDTQPGQQFICVVEIWDRKNGVVRTTAKGMNRWIREPYAPQHVPQRWYPFYVGGYNITEDQWRPLSDVELLRGLQEEYNETRQNYADARKDAVPKRVFRKAGGLTEDDVAALRKQGNREWIGVEGNPTVPLAQDIITLDGVAIKPEAYDTTLIRNDMDLVAGRSDASRANLIKPKTATEAEIMQQAMQTRTGERRDMNEDMMSEMGDAAMEIGLRTFSKKEIVPICGAECEWPDSPQGAEEAYQNVAISVRAGSSGKPNILKEREQWGQLLPQIEKAMTSIGELRINGNYQLADASLALLRETLQRFDEHLDLDAIIPPTQIDPETGKPAAETQAAMELVKCKQQLQLCQQELQKCQEALTKAQAGEQSKMAQIEAEKEIAVEKAKTDTVREQGEQARAEQKQKDEDAFARWKALLDAATKVVTSTLTATITANAKDPEAQEREAKAALSEERMATIIKDLRETMEGLGAAFDKFSQSTNGAGAR